jgi:AcrR family transcriptional regulator
MRRASTEAKKDERRAAILDRARHSLAQQSFEEIRLVDLAADLGLVKGTLYLYFPTKQDLFAALLQVELEVWWAGVLREPGLSPGRDMATVFTSQPLLVRLLASLHMAIEPGMSRQGLRALKVWFKGFALRVGQELEDRWPALEGQGFLFLMRLYALAIGASQLAVPPAAVGALLKEEEFALFRIEFAPFFAAAVDAWVR